ncbi:MAG: hypothetical protein EOO06_21280 [Chitinophagaceae bacterium]|nr:MAG: hypothetical protein EOO06_21280 [Chitinophagaceae bacterium]
MYFSDEDMDNPELDVLYKEFAVSKQQQSKYVIIKTEGWYDGDDLHMREVAVDTENPYIYTMARIKPFLISYGRNFMARMVMKEGLIDNLIIIHTDGILLEREHDFRGARNGRELATTLKGPTILCLRTNPRACWFGITSLIVIDIGRNVKN